MRKNIYFLCLCVSIVAGCDQKIKHTTSQANNADRLKEFVDKVKSELIFVEGGSFLIGDFGEKYGSDHLPIDAKQDSKPLHQVKLTGYSINKIKTSNEEYNFYLNYTGQQVKVVDLNTRKGRRWEEINSMPTTPAHVDWYESKKYCQWLASVTNLPYALPTEAQWEYAARSRGKYVIAPTNNGTISIENRKGINITSEDDREEFSRQQGNSLNILSPMPGNIRPPNSLGIYDMAGNGWEWVKDWYAPDYYKYSPVQDPQGPEKPIFKDSRGNYTKVIRSQDFSGPRRGATIARFNSDPLNQGYLPSDKTVRCVVNSPAPIK